MLSKDPKSQNQLHYNQSKTAKRVHRIPRLTLAIISSAILPATGVEVVRDKGR